jgi:uroporphyrinogen decarboxylase
MTMIHSGKRTLSCVEETAVTSKERVLAALNHTEPDRVPMGEMAFDHSLIEHCTGKVSYWRPFSNAKAQIAIWEGRRDEVVESWKEAVVFIAEKMAHDILAVQLAPSKQKPINPPRRIGPDTWEDASGNQLKYSAETKSILPVHQPQELDFGESDFPLVDVAEPDDSEWELVRFAVERYGRTHFIVARSDDGSWVWPGGMANGMVLLLEKPRVIGAAIGAATHQAIQTDRMFAREGCHGLMPSVDYAMNAGPLFDPRYFRDLALPHIQRQTQAAHDLELYVLKHACGNNWALMDMFVEAGYDAYQSIQESATMDIRRLKQEYGDRITLWGGVQVETLVRGTPQQVREEVVRAIKNVGPGGGFLLGASHSVVNATRPENYEAMLEAWREYRQYPIKG